MTSTFESRNPATGEVFETHEQHDANEIERRIAHCHAAFREWRNVPIEERSETIAAIGEELIASKSELARKMTDEMGKLLKQSEQEIDLCAQICSYTAENGASHLAEEQRSLPDGGRGIVFYRPIGIVYGIQPWNFPVYQALRFSISSLMAGNGVLLKHAANVIGSAKMLESIFGDAGLPSGLFAQLTIDHDQSDDVIADDRVRGVTFTGSPGAGRKVAAKAAEHLKKTVLELGSNDAYIVLEDADVASAVKACVTGRIYNNGETCVSAKRFVVADDVYDEFEAAFVERMKGLVMGDPTDESTRLGPIAREDLRATVHEQVEKSVAAGAKLLLGGDMPDGPGYFYPPTVLANVEPGQPAYDEEIFGPAAALIRAKDDEDALRIANDSRFGLGGAIFSKDEDKAVRLAKDEFDTGMVTINGFGLALPNMPFGGVKDSGYGREHGGFGIREFVNVKSVMVK